MFKNYKHIIWDWNGTLWNDAWLCLEITNNVMARRGMETMNEEVYQSRMGFPIKEYYRKLGFDFEKERYEDIAVEWIKEYEERRFKCLLQDDAREVLEYIKKLGITQSVLSAYKHETLLQAVTHFELNEYFSDVIGLEDIYAESKVANGVNYIQKLGIDPKEVLFVGDTVHDFEVADSISTDCALVLSGHNNRERLEAVCPFVFDSLSDIIAHESEI